MQQFRFIGYVAIYEDASMMPPTRFALCDSDGIPILFHSADAFRTWHRTHHLKLKNSIDAPTDHQMAVQSRSSCIPIFGSLTRHESELWQQVCLRPGKTVPNKYLFGTPQSKEHYKVKSSLTDTWNTWVNSRLDE